jgi:hypothetical protein
MYQQARRKQRVICLMNAINANEISPAPFESSDTPATGQVMISCNIELSPGQPAFIIPGIFRNLNSFAKSAEFRSPNYLHPTPMSYAT